MSGRNGDMFLRSLLSICNESDVIAVVAIDTEYDDQESDCVADWGND